ncbi:EutP/PduV family microcompartment system protein [Brevibacillus marinus]|uniref:EutP/PduV family microcompartment system protein n=1 Tax=Brevibacillus marinus TaxID=2496837 RepID=UPI000F82A382|nr:EutP/PduV family microcompartment system protein [Brevibacillus marinus]
MKRVMIIGAVGAGKSTLVKALFGDAQPARKTQALEYHDWIIDTPGEYTENPLYYRSLMATSLEAGLIMLVHDATRDRNYFPPGFAQGFPIPAIGVVTKVDDPQADVQKAARLLRESLPEGEVFFTSALTQAGIAELRSKLRETTG